MALDPEEFITELEAWNMAKEPPPEHAMDMWNFINPEATQAKADAKGAKKKAAAANKAAKATFNKANNTPPQNRRQPNHGETQTQPKAGVRGGCLRELPGSRCTKRRALQWRSQNCLQARVCNLSSPLNLVFVTASCFGSENGIFYHFLNQWHRFDRGSRKQITTTPVPVG
jgi:hypothetical protein